jgi:hypothetical protein
MVITTALIVVMSVLSNWAVWLMLRPPESVVRVAAQVIADVPDVSFDWEGLI